MKTFPQAEHETRSDERARLERKEFERKCHRTQSDQRGDEISAQSAITEFGRDMTRQEFKTDADINTLYAKFNIDELKRPVNWGGEIDYTIDLQTSLTAVAESKQAYNRLHPSLRDIYPTWREFLNGMEDGSLAKELKKLGLEKVSMQQVAEIDDEIQRDQRRSARIREREAADLADRVKKGEKFTPVPEGKPKD